METKRLHINHCNLQQIADSGQCFRWLPYDRTAYPGGGYLVHDGADRALICQNGSEIVIQCADGAQERWLRYLDIGTDYGRIINSIPETDVYLTRAAQVGAGLRILHADLWEMIVSFIVSQNNNIPRIKASVSAMCRKLGDRREDAFGEYYTFPTAQQLAAADNLQGLGLGYRDKYVAGLAENVCRGDVRLDSMAEMPTEDARRYLRSIYGIGEKVANCILLFGIGRKEAFPIDTWIRKIIDREYAGQFHAENYDGYAGVIQQYMFYAEREAARH